MGADEVAEFVEGSSAKLGVVLDVDESGVSLEDANLVLVVAKGLVDGVVFCNVKVLDAGLGNLLVAAYRHNYK